MLLEDLPMKCNEGSTLKIELLLEEDERGTEKNTRGLTTAKIIAESELLSQYQRNYINAWCGRRKDSVL